MTVAATGTNGIKSAGSVDVTGAITATTNASVGVSASGTLRLPSVDSITASSATAVVCSPTTSLTLVTTSDAAGNGTLANGVVGQVKMISLIAVGSAGTDDYVLTPATGNGYTTLTFAVKGDCATLVYTAAGWAVVSAFGIDIA